MLQNLVIKQLWNKKHDKKEKQRKCFTSKIFKCESLS